MKQLNLLPWRQHNRKMKKTRLVLGAIIAFLFALVVLGIMYRQVYRTYSIQQAKNDFIQSEISKEQIVLTNIKNELHTHFVYEEKIRAIINVKKISYNAIRLLNVLPTLGSNSISIMNISRMNNLITITGKAQSNAEITQFMNKIANQNTIFYAPNLTTITSEKNTSKDAGYFQIKIVEKDIV